MCKENMYIVHVGSQDSHAVYSVDVQIMRIKDVKIPTRQGQHKLYLPCCLLYHALAVCLNLCIRLLCLNILCTFSSCYTYLHTVLMYGIKILNETMGEPHAYLYKNCRTTYRKITSRK